MLWYQGKYFSNSSYYKIYVKEDDSVFCTEWEEYSSFQLHFVDEEAGVQKRVKFNPAYKVR